MKNVKRLPGMISIDITSTAMFVVCSDSEDKSCLSATADPVYVALIKDKTMGAGCDGGNPGSDIVSPSLEDETGGVLGSGEATFTI